jgi:hypothetical protein
LKEAELEERGDSGRHILASIGEYDAEHMLGDAKNL